MTESAPSQISSQALRLKRFLIASTTYALGLVILGLCSAAGLLPAASLLFVAGAFLSVNVALFAAFRSGWNLRFADPSLTLLQAGVAVTMVALVLVLGERIQFVAVPFYSSLFMFAMLQLKPRELVGMEIYVLVTYCAAIGLRMHLYAGRLDVRIEGIHAALVVLSSVWFTMAASYISDLRARLRLSKQAIERLASRDVLTDTWNRRHIDTLLAAEIRRKARGGTHLCICLIDVDHFKSINDRFGHLAGDAVLRHVAGAMAAELRSVDQLGRFGGEEFLVVLPGATLDAAAICADRLLRAVAGLNVLTDPADRVTISIGLAECTAGESSDTLLARADSALYQAKRDGRNRAETAVPREVPRVHGAFLRPTGPGALATESPLVQ